MERLKWSLSIANARGPNYMSAEAVASMAQELQQRSQEGGPRTNTMALLTLLLSTVQLTDDDSLIKSNLLDALCAHLYGSEDDVWYLVFFILIKLAAKSTPCCNAILNHDALRGRLTCRPRWPLMPVVPLSLYMTLMVSEDIALYSFWLLAKSFTAVHQRMPYDKAFTEKK